MTINLGSIDRALRLILGLALIAAPFLSGLAMFETNTASAVSVFVGTVLIATSAMRFCPLYRIFGLRTCKL